MRSPVSPDHAGWIALAGVPIFGRSGTTTFGSVVEERTRCTHSSNAYVLGNWHLVWHCHPVDGGLATGVTVRS